MEGQRLSGTITSSSEEETLSAATVLVRFLAGVTEGGFVCSRIDEMNAGYLIVAAPRGLSSSHRSGASPQTAAPIMWTP